jgi:ADP-heptose:LPS heptosyltransferase
MPSLKERCAAAAQKRAEGAREKLDLRHCTPCKEKMMAAMKAQSASTAPAARQIVPGQPQRIVLTNYQGLGDQICLTAAVRDLHLAHPGKFLTDLRVSCGQIWDHNPYVTHFSEPWIEAEAARCRNEGIQFEREGVLFVPATYAITELYHFIQAYHRTIGQALGVEIPCTAMKGDIHIHPDETRWMSQPQEMGVHGPFWLMVAGGKFDFTAKWPNPQTLAAVAEWFYERKVIIIQVGGAGDWQPAIPNTVNLVGQTDLRMLVRLAWHAQGMICPVTGLMHLAAALGKPCVVLAGGREPTHWEGYPTHRFLSMQGALPCCSPTSCDRARCTVVGDGDSKELPGNLCPRFNEYPAPKAPQSDRPLEKIRVAKCLDMISAGDIIRAVESYYQGGVLSWPK